MAGDAINETTTRAADEALIDIVELCLDSVVEMRRIIVRLESTVTLNRESRRRRARRSRIKSMLQ